MGDDAEPRAADLPLITTGISQLDEFLAGGLDPGTLVLLVEPSGAGAEIFAKQFAAGGAHSSVGRSVYVTTEESEQEVVRAFGRFGFPTVPRIVPVSEAYSRRILEKRDASSRAVRERSTKDLLSSDSGDLLQAPIPEDSDFLDELLRPYTTGSPPQRLTIHTLDFFLGLYGVDRVIDTLTAIKAANEQAGGLILMVLTGGSPHRAAAQGLLDRVASCLIELEFHRRGSQFEKFLLVKKVRNKFHGVGVAPYQVNERGFQLDNLNRIL
ncbi:MAG TPA: RAD55 family ATPase [Candidatus Thermoplasmatota archaeon]